MSTNQRDANASALVDIFARQAGTADPTRRSSAATITRRKFATRTARLTAAIDAERLRLFGFQLMQNVDGFTWEGEAPPGSWIQAGELQLQSFAAERELHDDAGNVVGYECTAQFVHKRFQPPAPSVDREARLPLLADLVRSQREYPQLPPFEGGPLHNPGPAVR